MKIIFDRDTLIGAVVPAMCAVAGKNTIAATEGILFKTDGKEKCTLTAYDTEKGFRTTISAKVEEGGSYIINANMLLQRIRTMPAGELVLEISERNIVKISQGKSMFELHALSGDDFPNLPELDGETGFIIKQGEFSKIIKNTSFAIAQNDPRPVLNGAFIKISGSKLTFVSCDGNRIAVREKVCELENKNSGEELPDFAFIIPGKTLTELVKLIGDGEEPVAVIFGRKHVIFRIGDIIFFSRLIDGEYIAYEKYIPKDGKLFAKIDRERFIRSLERAALVTEDRSMGQAKSAVKCLFEGGLLIITSDSITGRVYDEIAIEKEGDDLKIGFNCRYLLDALRSCDAEYVKATLSSAYIGILLENGDEDDGEGEHDNFTFLVQPINMKE